MSNAIDCQILKITAEEMEVRFENAANLRPGQLLRFSHQDSDASSGNNAILYGKLEALKREIINRAATKTDLDPETPSLKQAPSAIAKIKIILGETDLLLNQATILQANAIAEEVRMIQGEAQYPIKLGNGPDALSVDLSQLGTLSMIYGDTLEEKLNLLRQLINGIQQYQRVVVVDPLGIFQGGLSKFQQQPGQFQKIQAGLDAGLSLQSIGLKRFLTYLSQMLPDVIRADALELLAEVIPYGHSFVPFRDLLNLETITERSVQGISHRALAMKTPLLNCLYDIDRQQIFANSPREVFSIRPLMRSNLSVVDLSSLGEPWKTLFYEETCLELLANADGDILPVLIYPENYLNDFTDYIKKANEADFSLLVIASPYYDPSLLAMADNRFYWNSLGDPLLEGRFTFNLPVTLDEDWLKQTPEEIPPAISASQNIPQNETINPLEARFYRQAPIAAPAPTDPQEWQPGMAGQAKANHQADEQSKDEYGEEEHQGYDGYDSILGGITPVLSFSPEQGLIEPHELTTAEAMTADKRQAEQKHEAIGTQITPPSSDFMEYSDPKTVATDDLKQTKDMTEGTPRSGQTSVHSDQDQDEEAQAADTIFDELKFDLEQPPLIENGAGKRAEKPDRAPEEEDFYFDLNLLSVPAGLKKWAESQEQDDPLDALQFEQIEDFSELLGIKKSQPDFSDIYDLPLDATTEKVVVPTSIVTAGTVLLAENSISDLPPVFPKGTSFIEEQAPTPDIPPKLSEREATVLTTTSQSSAEHSPDEHPADLQTENLPPASNAKEAEIRFETGNRVQSDKYGVGTVQKVIPMEVATAVHILFDNGAKRTIVPSPNNLQKLDA